MIKILHLMRHMHVHGPLCIGCMCNVSINIISFSSNSMKVQVGVQKVIHYRERFSLHLHVHVLNESITLGLASM